MSDQIVSFTFEEYPVRGALVRLETSWARVLETSLMDENDQTVRETLARCIASGLLLSTTIKMQGSLLLQMLGEGPLSMLLVEVFISSAGERLGFRSMARTNSEQLALLDEVNVSTLIQNGKLALTLDPEGASQAYQSIVPLTSDSIDGIFESYMKQSEQIDTRLFLSFSEGIVRGVLLQAMPEEDLPEESENTSTASNFLDSVSTNITSCMAVIQPYAQLPDTIQALFPEYDIRVFEQRDVSFVCTCSKDKIESLLLTLGQEDAQNIVKEEGSIRVSCEFCGRQFEFDSIDTTGLFSPGGISKVDSKWKN
jgi:molecular chaperone Hsp33